MDVEKKLLSDGSFSPARTVSGEGGQFFNIFGMTSNFASELVWPPPHSIQELNVFEHQKHVVSRPGCAMWCFHRKNYRKFIKWDKATKLVMHPSDDGGTL